jgi:hypothetical protein
MTNLNGMNYSNIVIDELQLTLGGNYYYLGVDAFTWVKDSNIVLGTAETKASKRGDYLSQSNKRSPYDSNGQSFRGWYL